MDLIHHKELNEGKSYITECTTQCFIVYSIYITVAVATMQFKILNSIVLSLPSGEGWECSYKSRGD